MEIPIDRAPGSVSVEALLDRIDALETTAAIVNAIPTVDPEDGETIWNDDGVLKVASTA